MMMDPINLEPTVEKIAQPQKPQANTSIEIIPVIYEIIRRFVYVFFFNYVTLNFDIFNNKINATK